MQISLRPCLYMLVLKRKRPILIHHASKRVLLVKDKTVTLRNLSLIDL